MTNKRSKVAKLSTRRLADLRPHPRQGTYFDPPTSEEVAALAEDIRRHGQRAPIELIPSHNRAGLPANTILSGHSRWKARERLGDTEVKVLVRHELRGPDAAAVEAYVLGANQFRRHLDPLAKARVAERLFRIERRAGPGRLSGTRRVVLFDRLGKVVDVSGRHLGRFLRVLATPTEVQNAYRRGVVAMVLAEKVADLSSRDQRDIARRIRSGQDPKAVILTLLPPRREGHIGAADALNSFVKAMGRGLKDLSDRVDQVRPNHLTRHAETLHRAAQVISELVQKQGGTVDPKPAVQGPRKC